MILVQAHNPTKSGSDLLKLLTYVVVVLLGGALLTPVIAFLGQSFLVAAGDAPEGWVAWLASEIRKADYPRYFSRGSQICAILLLWPFIRWTGMNRSLFPTTRPLMRGFKDYARGFAFAGVLLLLLGLVLTQLGVYRLRPEPSWTAIGTPLSAALGAGILEELFFRGAILGLLLRSLKPWIAILGCSFLFAFVHFLKPPPGWQASADGPAWSRGFEVLGGVLGGFGDTTFLLAEFATLFAVGWVLSVARVKTGQLWLSMGLHGGWIFGLKYFSALTLTSKPLKNGDWLPWIGVNLKIGLLPLTVIALTGWLALRWASRASSTDG